MNMRRKQACLETISGIRDKKVTKLKSQQFGSLSRAGVKPQIRIEEISKEDVSSIFLYKIPFLVQNTNNINVIL